MCKMRQKICLGKWQKIKQICKGNQETERYTEETLRMRYREIKGQKIQKEYKIDMKYSCKFICGTNSRMRGKRIAPLGRNHTQKVITWERWPVNAI